MNDKSIFKKELIYDIRKYSEEKIKKTEIDKKEIKNNIKTMRLEEQKGQIKEKNKEPKLDKNIKKRED